MRILGVLLIASCAAGQTPQTKAPTYTTENITKQVPHCETGWHLEQWHYGTNEMNTFVPAVYISDPSGYRASIDFPKADPHPDRCVKDEIRPRKDE